MQTSALKKLQNPSGEYLTDEKEKVDVYHVRTPQLLIQASGYLKHIHGTNGPTNVFFRGQGQLYGGALTPSLYRGISSNDRQKAVYDALSEYLAQIESEGAALRYVERHIREPLLQHYGIRTHWIDLVDNIWVALWFACHEACVTGRLDEYLHFERRKSSDSEYAYILSLETEWTPQEGRPGCYHGLKTETVDLRVAAPSHFVRPHAQHAILTRKKPKRVSGPVDCSSLIVGVIRVNLEDAFEWLGNGILLTPHTLFPSPYYDYGYRELLEKAPETTKCIGAINHIGV